MNTATITAPPRFARPPAPPRRATAPTPRHTVIKTTAPTAPSQTAAKTEEDPYQGFSKRDYEELCEMAALYNAGKLKFTEHELPEIPELDELDETFET